MISIGNHQIIMLIINKLHPDVQFEIIFLFYKKAH
jgi:hypothetical protein